MHVLGRDACPRPLRVGVILRVKIGELREAAGRALFTGVAFSRSCSFAPQAAVDARFRFRTPRRDANSQCVRCVSGSARGVVGASVSTVSELDAA